MHQQEGVKTVILKTLAKKSPSEKKKHILQTNSWVNSALPHQSLIASKQSKTTRTSLENLNLLSKNKSSVKVLSCWHYFYCWIFMRRPNLKTLLYHIFKTYSLIEKTLPKMCHFILATFFFSFSFSFLFSISILIILSHF